MKLYYSPTSPFVRKVNLLAIEAGLETKIEHLPTNPWQAEKELVAENPLSQVPTLITDEGMTIYDSRVICEYLDSLHTGEKLFPETGKQRWQALQLQSLADGILDAGILRFLEAKRELALRSADWDLMQKRAISRGLASFEDSVSEWKNDLNIGVITVACLLGWLDFRFSHEDWKSEHTKLSQWFTGFSLRPSMLATVPHEA
jgi:glutathione S-transferase